MLSLDHSAVVKVISTALRGDCWSKHASGLQISTFNSHILFFHLQRDIFSTMIVNRSLLLYWILGCHLMAPSVADNHHQDGSNLNYAVPDHKRVPIIKIESDGISCPSGFKSASRQNIPGVGLTCLQTDRNMAGNTPVRENKATCCTKDYQDVFLVSIAGHDTPRPRALYTLDAKTCCPSNQVQAETGVQQCKYEGKSLKVQYGELTHCCWDTARKDFHAHLKDYSVGIRVPLNNDTTLPLDNPVCKSVYIKAGIATARASNVQIDVFAELRCGTFGNKSDNQTLTINFNRNRRKAGTFTFGFSVGNAVADISSQLAETGPGSGHYDIKLHGDVFGTAILGPVHVPFDHAISHNEYLDSYIGVNGVC